MKICTIDGCTDAHNAKGLCNKHYNRWKRHRSFDKPTRPSQAGSKNYNWRGDGAAYMTVHTRLKVDRGPAALFSCVDCDGPASQWAYTNDCPNERQSRFGRYSTDLSRYQPMCVPCHKKFDYNAGLVSA